MKNLIQWAIHRLTNKSIPKLLPIECWRLMGFKDE